MEFRLSRNLTLCLLLTALTLGAIAPPAMTLADEQESGSFYQKVAVSRNPKFLVSGVAIEQLLQYEIISKLEVGPSQGAGALSVKQTVVSGRLLKADPLSQSSYAAALKKIAGTTFRYEFNDSNRVISFRGGKAEKEAIAIKDLSLEKLMNSKGFLLTSLIDDDGWKELAELTFFQPPPQKKQWVSQFHHDWTPLGSWTGETTYAIGRKRGKWQVYGYKHDVKYNAPGAEKDPKAPGRPGAAAKDKPKVSGLPFTLKGADFTPINSGGQIVYDKTKSRIESAEEIFHVRGVVAANVLGQDTRVQLEEKQMFKIQLNDQNAWSQ